MALLVQFLLGMTINLFVIIPRSHPGADATPYATGIVPGVGWAIAHEWPWLSLHVLLGLTLVVVSLTGLRGIRTGRISVIVASIVGPIAAISAALNGAAFVIYQNDVNSMYMAASFAVAIGAVIVSLYLARTGPSVPGSGAP